MSSLLFGFAVAIHPPGALQGDLQQLFSLLDRTVHAVETGTVPKANVAAALEVYLKVGEPGGKTRERFDALMQALDADQEGPVVTYKKLFEEDREYNQGPCFSTTPPPSPTHTHTPVHLCLTLPPLFSLAWPDVYGLHLPTIALRG